MMSIKNRVDSEPPTRIKRYIIYPKTLWKSIFDIIAASLIIYFCIVIPYRIAFMFKMANNFFIQDQVFDIFLLADIVLRFFTAIERDTKLVDSHRVLAKNYFNHMFILDLIACFPFYLITPYLYWLKIIRLIRAHHLIAAIKELMVSLLGSKDKASEWKKVNVVLQILSFIISLGLIVHCIACVWIYILQIEPHPLKQLDNGDIVQVQWTNGGVWTFIDNTSVYIASIYWTVFTFATVGYGDITPLTDNEVVFTMFVEMQGIIFFTYLMGKVTTMVADYTKKHYQSTQEQAGMNKWLIRLGGSGDVKLLSPEINKEIEEHFKLLWKNDHGNLILDSPYIRRLPYRLREEVLDFMFEDEIKKFSCFFTACDRYFKHKIIGGMCPRYVQKKRSEIISADQYGNELYFIVKSRILVMKNDEEILILPENSHFGEDLLIFNNKSEYSYLLNNSSVDLFVISKAQYMDILKFFPEEKQRAQQRAYLRRKYLEKVADVVLESSNTGEPFGDKVMKVDEIQRKFYATNGVLSDEQNAELEKLLHDSLLSDNKIVDLQELTDKFSALDSALNRIAERLLA